MKTDTIRPRGHMILNLLDETGQVMETFAQSNQVLNGGRALLLSLLKGDRSVTEYQLILGEEGFNADIAKPLGQRTVVPVKLTGKASLKMTDGELRVTFRGNVERDAVVVGGGMVVNSKTASAETTDLYNFAKTPRPIEMAAGQSVSVNFQLAME